MNARIIAVICLQIFTQTIDISFAHEAAGIPKPNSIVKLLLSPEFLLKSAIFTLLVNFTWNLAGRMFDHLWLFWHQIVSEFVLELGPCEQSPDYFKSIGCQIVRFGTDKYIHSLASDREKYHGRLQNYFIEAAQRELIDAGLRLKFNIPVHTRLGTQFKLFCDIDNSSNMDKAQEFLSGCHVIEKAEKAGPTAPLRIYVLLETCEKTKTVDGFTNNMLFPAAERSKSWMDLVFERVSGGYVPRR